MAELWGVLGALATIVVPMALAGWLLGRKDRGRRPHDDVHERRREDEGGG